MYSCNASDACQFRYRLTWRSQVKRSGRSQNWQAEYVMLANEGGIERVLLQKG